MSKSLFRSTAVFAIMTMLSRIMGFARDMVCANLFGAAGSFDAFVVAFKVPNFMRRLFAEGAFSQAFVPILAEYYQTRTPEETQTFINRVAGNLSLALVIVIIIGELFAPIVVTIFAPGFLHRPDQFDLATNMLRVTMPYIGFISLAAFCAAILNCYNAFAIPALTPILLNIALIAAALGFRQYFDVPVYVLAWGVFVGGILQLVFQLPFLWRKKVIIKPQMMWRDEGVRRLLRLILPALFGVSVAQISLLIDTLFASFLPTGSISWLYYSDRLIQFPLGVFGVGLATVVLPHLAKRHAVQAKEQFEKTLAWGFKCVFVIAIPSLIGLFMLAGPLLTTLFQYGRFNDFDVLMSERSLRAFALGLPAFMLVKLLASGYYSRQDIKTPVKIAVVALITNMILNFILIFPLAHAGLALATSISSWVNAGLLYFILTKIKLYKTSTHWWRYGLQLLVPNVIMGLWLWWFSPNLSIWLGWQWQARGLHLAFLVISAIVVYTLCLWIVGLRLKHFRGVD